VPYSNIKANMPKITRFSTEMLSTRTGLTARG
jgi:hypothetical protein